jgi:hypothetical protein
MVLEKGAGPVTDSAVIEARNDVLPDRQSSKPSPENKQDLRELVLSEIGHFAACLDFMRREAIMVGKQLKAGAITAEQAQYCINNLSDPSEILRRSTQ